MREIIARFWFICKSREVYVILLIVFVSGASFGLGRLSVPRESSGVRVYKDESLLQTALVSGQGSGVKINNTESTRLESPTTPTGENSALYVGSKTGEKYHLPWCSGALRISEANKIYFNSKEEAEKAGYTPAANCKGL